MRVLVDLVDGTRVIERPIVIGPNVDLLVQIIGVVSFIRRGYDRICVQVTDVIILHVRSREVFFDVPVPERQGQPRDALSATKASPYQEGMAALVGPTAPEDVTGGALICEREEEPPKSSFSTLSVCRAPLRSMIKTRGVYVSCPYSEL